MITYGRIYKITNLVNGKLYIGQTTKTVQKRWEEHCKARSRFSLIAKSIHKYGSHAFVVEEIASAGTQIELDRLEIEAIIAHKSLVPHGYNLREGGNGGKLHDISIAKLKQVAQTNWGDPIYRVRLLARILSPEATNKRQLARSQADYKRMMSISVTKALNSADVRKKISQGVKRKCADPEWIQRRAHTLRATTQTSEFRERRSRDSKMLFSNPDVTARYAARNKSEEFRKKVSDGMKRRWRDPEYRTKSTGRKASLETREKIRKVKSGRKLTIEHRAKISASLIGNTRTKGLVLGPRRGRNGVV